MYLTDEGRRVQEALVGLANENMAAALEGVSEADLETAKVVVRRIIINTSG